MRIGILGTRGIPNTYGGFEQFAEHFSVLAVEKGHEVSVYCSSLHAFQEAEYKGVHLIHCQDPEDKLGTFGQFIYDRNCLKDAKFRNYDILLMLGYTSSSVWMRMIPKNTVSISNMDGLEWKRSKYSYPVKLFLQKAESWAAKKSDFLIADSPAIQEYLHDKYQREASYIAYGAEVFKTPDPSVLRSFGMQAEGYSLVIARPEPENNVHIICDAYSLLETNKPLLVIGNFENEYGKELKRLYQSDKIRFLGPIYDLEVLNQLRYFSHLYFHGHSVGGTNPSLLEAMASNAFICAHDNVFNRAVLGQDALYFSHRDDLLSLLRKDPPKQLFTDKLEANKRKIEEHYSWNTITDQMLKLFEKAKSHG